MRTGFNKELARKASMERLNLNSPPEAEFDFNGEVVRDFKKELDLYVENEERFVLPDTDVGYFNSHKILNDWQKTKSDFQFKKSTVKVVKLQPKPKSNFILDVVNFINGLRSKFSKEDLHMANYNKFWYYRFIVIPYPKRLKGM